MTYNFYTIFGKEFLAKAVAQYDSLARHCPGDFRLWMLCLDDEAYDLLKKLDLRNVIPMSLSEVEDSDLLETKKDRTVSEYSWTLKPSAAKILFARHPDMDVLFYLDTDIYFYSSIEPLYREFESASIMLFPHRLPAGKKDQEEKNGIYNAGMIMFRNDANGRECLEWWRLRCNEWCYRKPEPGLLGDQKYLDLFEEKFKRVKICQNLGADVAPWNIKNYRGTVVRKNGTTYVLGAPLVCFHFSGFYHYYPHSALLPDAPVNGYDYTLPSPEKKYIYNEYMSTVFDSYARIHIISPDFSEGALLRPPVLTALKKDLWPLLKQLVKTGLQRSEIAQR